MPLSRRRRFRRVSEDAETGRVSTISDVPDEGDRRPTSEQQDLRPSIRSGILRNRIERIEALPLTPTCRQSRRLPSQPEPKRSGSSALSQKTMTAPSILTGVSSRDSRVRPNGTNRP